MLELRNITKIYETGSEDVHALRGVSINFRPNEFVSILGQSGCGKTTLLNIMGGLDHYTDGDLVINGVSTKEYEDADWDAYRNHSIGFVFQNYNLIHHQTVLSNVMLALTLSGVSEEETRKRAIEALEAVGLGDQINKKPAQMSGGQMQRVAIARALINNPDILLADEPTGALDSETSIQIMSILKKVAEDRLVIMVTHNPELAAEYSTRIIRLADGLVTGDSNPYNEAAEDGAEAEDGSTDGSGINLNATDGAADGSDAEDGSARKRKHGHKSERLRSMSMKTALGLSLNNLMTKKARTILTSFAGSIGIIGIALILSVSTGFQDYIDQIENDTLTSYPLTIESETADMSSMLTAFGTSVEESKGAKKGEVKEMQMMSRMFASVGSNDLTSFKNNLEKKDDEIGDNFKWIQSSYGVVPNVYSTSFEYGIQQVSPGSLMSSYFNTLQQTAMSYSNMDVFFELVNNESMVEENYKVLKGEWPTKYNEVVLVLQDEKTLSDYVSYSLGLRNPQELKDMVNAMMTGEQVSNDSEPLKWDYDDLLGMEFALVATTDKYKYNSGYNVWEDMSSDEAYMKELINNSEKLKITCIACPNPDNTSAMVTSGVGYLPELTEHIIDSAADTDIVKQQLANKDVDVFSGKTFEDLKNNINSGLGFGDMISIDEVKLASALGGNLSEDAIKKLIEDNTKNALKDIDPTPIAQAVLEDLTTQLTAVNTSLATTYTDASGKVTIPNTVVVGTTVQSNYSTGQYSAIVNKLLDKYATKLTAEFEANNLSLTSAQIMALMGETLKDKENTSLVSDYATGLAIQQTAGNVPTAMANLALKMGSMFNVDPSGIADAFTMTMDEDELTRLISSSMSSSSSSSYGQNLRSLGYAEYDNPYRMLFYLKDFDAKENFMDFIDKYNDEMKASDQDDKVINYTDYTGIMMKSVKKITNSVSYVLIAFVAISLIVSSIMIGVITYISVLERTKEIGILRAIGASKKDISRIFNAETIIVGFCAGIMGIIVSLLLLIPINAILYKLTAIATLRAKLPVVSAFILVAISVMLTFIAGLIPSGMAAKKDPVEALRTE